MARLHSWRGIKLMALLTVVLMLLLLPSATLAKRKSKSTSTAASRMDELATLTADNPVMQLTTVNYTRYIVKAPRLYDTVTFFTVKQDCAACEEALRLYKHIAHSYQRHWTNREGLIDESQKRLFFFVVHYQTVPKAFHASGLETVPQVGFRGASKVKTPEAMTLIESMEHFGEMHQVGLVPFLDKHNGFDYPVVQPAESHRDKVVLGAFVLALIIGLVGDGHLMTLVMLPTKKGFWLFICLTVYAVSVSGAIYCVIRDEAFMRVSPTTQKFSLFSQSSKTQLVGEGVVVACLNLLFAGSVVLMLRVSFADESTMRKWPFGAKTLNGLFVLLVLSVCVFAAVQITSLYSEKSGWYNVKTVIAKVANVEPNSMRKSTLKGMRAVIGKDYTKVVYTWYKNMVAALL